MAKLILLQHNEHRAGFFREKNKRILSNKSAQGRIKRTAILLDSLEYMES